MEISISKKNWDKIIDYAKAAYNKFSAEIGGMAVCYKDKDDDWIIDDPIILKQEVSGGNCVLDKEELAKYYTKVGASKKYKDLEEKYRIDHIKRSGSDDDQHSQIYQELMDMLKEISIFIDLIAERLAELETVE